MPGKRQQQQPRGGPASAIPAAAAATEPADPDAVAPAAPPKRRLVMLSGTGDSSSSSDTCRTFVFKEESHTLGNALKNVILQNPSVAFCGYSIPHPAEDQMLLRIQTVPGVAAQDVLRKGLQDLKVMCQVTRTKFEEEVEDFKAAA